jgi:hypothetical protein
MKQCARCLEQKELAEFSKDASRRDGKQPYCKTCNSSYALENKARIRQRRQAIYRENKDTIKARVQEYTAKNRDEINARRRVIHTRRAAEKNAARRQAYAQDPSKVLRQLQVQRRANSAKVRAYDRHRYRQNPDRFKANARNRKARKKQAEGSFTGVEWNKLKEQYNNCCLRCGKSEQEAKLTPDHIQPLSRGGSNYIANIQPLCLECNLWKSTKTIAFR